MLLLDLNLILLRLLLLLIPKNPDIQLSRFHHPITTPNPKPRLKIQTNPEIIINYYSMHFLFSFFIFFFLSHLSLSLQTLKRTSINALRWWVSLCRHKNLPKQEAKTNDNNNKLRKRQTNTGRRTRNHTSQVLLLR